MRRRASLPAVRAAVRFLAIIANKCLALALHGPYCQASPIAVGQFRSEVAGFLVQPGHLFADASCEAKYILGT